MQHDFFENFFGMKNLREEMSDLHKESQGVLGGKDWVFILLVKICKVILL